MFSNVVFHIRLFFFISRFLNELIAQRFFTGRWSTFAKFQLTRNAKHFSQTLLFLTFFRRYRVLPRDQSS